MNFAAAVILAASLAIQQQQTSQELLDQMKVIIAELERRLAQPAPGTGVAPADLQRTLAAAQPGTTVFLQQGIQYQVGSLRIPQGVRLSTLGVPSDRAQKGNVVVNGSDTIYTSSGATLDHVLVSGNSGDMISCGYNDDRQTTLEQQPTKVTIVDNHIDGLNAAKRAIAAHCSGVTIMRNHIENIARVGQDTQGVYGVNGSGPFVIENNYIEAAGENIMFGGDDPRIPGLVPADITIRGNTMTKDPAWRGTSITVKNLFELKAARRVLFENNIMEYVWCCGQTGFAIQLTVQSQNGRNPQVQVEEVEIRRNTVRNVGGGINLLGFAQINTSLQTRRITIADNSFEIDRATYGGQGWCLFMGREPREVTYEYNYCNTNGNQIVYQEGNPVLEFIFRGNLIPRSGAYGFTGNVNGTNTHRGAGTSIYLPGAILTGSAFGSFPTPANMPGNMHMSTTAMLPLIVDGRGTGALAPYGPRPQ